MCRLRVLTIALVAGCSGETTHIPLYRDNVTDANMKPLARCTGRGVLRNNLVI